MNKIHELPQGYELVAQVEPEALDQLLSDVVAASDPDEHAAYLNGDHFDTGIQFGNYEASDRFYIGVVDKLDELVAYAGATLKKDDAHATLDTIVVKKWHRGEGIGTALAQLLIRGLDAEGVDTMSFQPYGEAKWLMEYLTAEQGFTYNSMNREYLSYREGITWLSDDSLSTASSESLSANQNSKQKERIGTKECQLFCEKVKDLVKRCVEHINAGKPESVTEDSVFILEKAGRQFDISYDDFGDSHGRVYGVGDEADEMELANDEGNIISSTRHYWVHDFGDNDLDPHYTASNEGFMVAGGFTTERYEKIMKHLRGLSVEHIVSYINRHDQG